MFWSSRGIFFRSFSSFISVTLLNGFFLFPFQGSPEFFTLLISLVTEACVLFSVSFRTIYYFHKSCKHINCAKHCKKFHIFTAGLMERDYRSGCLASSSDVCRWPPVSREHVWANALGIVWEMIGCRSTNSECVSCCCKGICCNYSSVRISIGTSFPRLRRLLKSLHPTYFKAISSTK